MTLSSLLLGARGGIDDELDELFRSSVCSQKFNWDSLIRLRCFQKFATIGPAGQKRKLEEEEDPTNLDYDDVKKKRMRASRGTGGEREKARLVIDRKSKAMKNNEGIRKAKTTGQGNEQSEQDEDDDLLEDSYFPEKLASNRKDPELNNSLDSDPEEDHSKLVHESLSSSTAKSRGRSSRAKPKYSPVEETPEQRDSRTIFIGNLPLEVARKKVRSTSRFPMSLVIINVKQRIAFVEAV